ncbi:MAG: hypothetical protein C5B43_01825 [Verrucomicrobia bacterium]|nr:MAG: hypothetical protein C5B43_01825 [Verrucomicrobiota bacterium]
MFNQIKIKNMKKLIAVVLVSILSLLNGVAAHKDHREQRQTKALVKDTMPLIIIASISSLVDLMPDLVREVAKENNIDLNEIKKNCKRLMGEIENLKRTGINKKVDINEFDFLSVGLQKINDMCVKKGCDLNGLNANKEYVKCLLTSYNSSLVHKAERIIRSLKK